MGLRQTRHVISVNELCIRLKVDQLRRECKYVGSLALGQNCPFQTEPETACSLKLNLKPKLNRSKREIETEL